MSVAGTGPRGRRLCQTGVSVLEASSTLTKGVARSVRMLCKVLVYQFTWPLISSQFQAQWHGVAVQCTAWNCMQLPLPLHIPACCCATWPQYTWFLLCCPSAWVYHVFFLRHPWCPSYQHQPPGSHYCVALFSILPSPMPMDPSLGKETPCPWTPLSKEESPPPRRRIFHQIAHKLPFVAWFLGSTVACDSHTIFSCQSEGIVRSVSTIILSKVAIVLVNVFAPVCFCVCKEGKKH